MPQLLPNNAPGKTIHLFGLPSFLDSIWRLYSFGLASFLGSVWRGLYSVWRPFCVRFGVGYIRFGVGAVQFGVGYVRFGVGYIRFTVLFGFGLAWVMFGLPSSPNHWLSFSSNSLGALQGHHTEQPHVRIAVLFLDSVYRPFWVRFGVGYVRFGVLAKPLFHSSMTTLPKPS